VLVTPGEFTRLVTQYGADKVIVALILLGAASGGGIVLMSIRQVAKAVVQTITSKLRDGDGNGEACLVKLDDRLDAIGLRLEGMDGRVKVLEEKAKSAESWRASRPVQCPVVARPEGGE
jgi:hypothetical protein